MKNLGIEWGGATSGPYGLQFGELASIGGVFQRLERIVATLNFLEREGKAHIRSNPRLVVMDGETGEMSVIREEYFAITTGTAAYPTTSLETISAGVILKVFPRIVGDGEIILSLSPEVSNVVGSGIQELPVISRRKVNTTVRVKSGETIVIGGLRQLIEVTATSKIPLLGDLPLIGGLFRSKKTTVDDKDIVMLITPTIME
ncbi:MAG: type II secretion system protein GspD [Candidatus Caldatribacteriaceae bacterium]